MLAAGLLAGVGLGTVWFLGFPGIEAAGSSVGGPGVISDEGSDPRPYLPAPVVGSPAPDFGLADLEGNAWSLMDLRGSVVLLNFWATWCSPCEAEMPMLNAAYRRYRDQGLVVLAVNFDEPQDEVQTFHDRLELSFPVLLDPGGEVQELYRVRGYPTTFVVDREGVVRVEHIGILSEANVVDYLAEAGLDQP